MLFTEYPSFMLWLDFFLFGPKVLSKLCSQGQLSLSFSHASTICSKSCSISSQVFGISFSCIVLFLLWISIFFFFLVKKYMLSTTYSPYHRLLILCLVYNPDRYFWSSLLNFNLQFNFVVHLTFIFPWKFWPSFFIMHSAVFFTSRNLFGVPFKAM